MNRELLNKFSNHFKKSLRDGADLAVQLKQKYVQPEHLLYGLLNQKGSVGAEIITGAQQKLPLAVDFIKAEANNQELASGELPNFSSAAKKIIQSAVQIAYLNGHKYIGSEHLLAALLKNEAPTVKTVLALDRAGELKLTEQAQAVLASASKLPELTETFKKTAARKSANDFWPEEENYQENSEGLLEIFGRNLTSAQCQSRIDPVIGREKEIERLIQILSRRTKNNPLILGEPGVGKTAIVEGLAKKILSGAAPEILQDKKIYALDLPALVAGTIYRGEFENRLKQLIDEIKSRPEVILFIDEIHGLMGAGSATGSLDAANILKPYLARGDIHCIGATTYQDYRKSIENDPALARRFQPIKISEPTAAETKKILNGLKSYLEKFHRVKISSGAIDSAVNLSQKYLPEKFLPDKAIDLLDEAAAAMRAKNPSSLLEKELKQIAKELTDLEQALERLIIEENYQAAINIKQTIEQIKVKLQAAQNLKNQEKNKFIGEINALDIARIISRITGISDESILISEEKKILNLSNTLNQKIIGQATAINAIVNSIQRAKAGLNSDGRPLASFLFIGSSGVGKTLTAKILAQEIFNDEQALIKIDMSEYSEKFNLSKLVGAPAGYVGYKESGQLTEKIKHRPYALILLDEVEKANREVFDLLLQVLDDGFLTDGSGTKINFQNTIIIMTANLGSQYFQDNNGIGFGSANEQQNFQEKIIKEAKEFFRPEFLNRLDQIVYFDVLGLAELKAIAKMELDLLKNRLKNKGVNFKFSAQAVAHIAQEGLKQKQGARAIKKIIQESVETPLSQKLLATADEKSKTLSLTVKNGIIEIV